MTETMVDGTIALQVVGFAATTALVAEVLQWWFIFRKPEFRSLKAGLDKALAKVDQAKEGVGGAASLKKREAALQKHKDAVAKHLAFSNFKSGAIMLVVLLASYRMMSSLFGGAGVVVRLPFEPPPFLQKLTQRGLDNPGVRDASALFIYVLCQSSLRPLIGKLLGWGPSRSMTEISPALPKSLGGETKKDI